MFNIGGFTGECHEIEWKTGILWYRRAEGAYVWQPATQLSPSPEAWERFWQDVDAAGVWEWEKSYENLDVLDGTQWSLKLKYQGRRLTAEGSNAYPGHGEPEFPATCEFGKFITALQQLTGKAGIR